MHIYIWLTAGLGLSQSLFTKEFLIIFCCGLDLPFPRPLAPSVSNVSIGIRFVVIKGGCREFLATRRLSNIGFGMPDETVNAREGKQKQHREQHQLWLLVTFVAVSTFSCRCCCLLFIGDSFWPCSCHPCRSHYCGCCCATTTLKTVVMEVVDLEFLDSVPPKPASGCKSLDGYRYC